MEYMRRGPGSRDTTISVDASFGFTLFLNLSVVELLNVTQH